VSAFNLLAAVPLAGLDFEVGDGFAVGVAETALGEGDILLGAADGGAGGDKLRDLLGGLEVRSSKKNPDRMPLLGRIAAGRPVEAVESSESISVNDIIGNREVYCLEVNGDSMCDEHIMSGDVVMVERTRTAREGEIIVALVDGSETTLKRFYREGTMIRLQPSNAAMPPIYAPAANVAIQGKVLGLLRKYL